MTIDELIADLREITRLQANELTMTDVVVRDENGTWVPVGGMSVTGNSLKLEVKILAGAANERPRRRSFAKAFM